MKGLSDKAQNPLFFAAILFKTVYCDGLISHSDQLKTLHDCLLASAHICTRRKKQQLTQPVTTLLTVLVILGTVENLTITITHIV